MRQGRAISFEGSVSPVALILIFENIALEKQLCLYSRARRPAKSPKIFERLMGRNVSRKKRFGPFATRILDQTRQSRTFANRMKNTKPDSVFAKTASSFAFKRKGQFRSISLDRIVVSSPATQLSVLATDGGFQFLYPDQNVRLDTLIL